MKLNKIMVLFINLSFLSNYLPLVVVHLIEIGILVGLAYKIFIFLLNQKRKERKSNYPKDVVILHQFPRGIRAPSMSPFPIKLETWFKI